MNTTRKSRTSNTRVKRRGVLALSLLLIAAMVLPQAVLATDGGAGMDASKSAAQVQATANSDISGDETAAISTETQLENSGGGGQKFR